MIIRFVPATIAHMAAATHVDLANLPVLGVEGDFLVFDFGADATRESALESLQSLREALGENLSTTEETAEAAGLTALLTEIDRGEREVERAFASVYNTASETEPTAPEPETQLHTNTHAAINESPSSNDADSQDEELIDNGQEAEGTRRRKRG